MGKMSSGEKMVWAATYARCLSDNSTPMGVIEAVVAASASVLLLRSAKDKFDEILGVRKPSLIGERTQSDAEIMYQEILEDQND